METKKSVWFRKGMKAGIPVGLGYFACSISLGVMSISANLTIGEAVFTSAMLIASAGQYAFLNVILASGTLYEMALLQLITNCRYLLMSCSLGQKLENKTNSLHRFICGFMIVDELFGIASSQEGKVSPYFYEGMMSVALPGWLLGTFLGALLGNILPVLFVNALCVALYGMFIAIVFPAGRKDKKILLFVLLSMLFSYLSTIIPKVKDIPSSIRVVILTVILTTIASLVFPLPKEEEETK